MKFYDIDVLAKKYGDGNKYIATSLIAERACRLSEKRNSGDNNIQGSDPKNEKYLSEVLAQFDKGMDIEAIMHEETIQENDSMVMTADE